MPAVNATSISRGNARTSSSVTSVPRCVGLKLFSTFSTYVFSWIVSRIAAYVEGRPLGEVLLRVELHEAELLARLERRQLPLLVLLLALGLLLLLVLGAGLLLGRLRAVHREVARELEDGARGAEGRAAGADVRGGLVVDRRDHLARDEAVPDELVQPEHVPLADLLEERRHLLRAPLEVRRADRLVRFLRRLRLRLVDVGRLGQVILPVLLRDVDADRVDRR